MELKEYFKIFRTHFRLILSLALFSVVVAFLVSLNLKTKYRASMNLYVKRQAEKPSEQFYTYGGYYSQQAAEKYTETVLGFLESQDILRRSAEVGGFSTDQKTLEDLESDIKVKKVAPQLIYVTVKRMSQPESEKLVTSLTQATIEQAKLLNQGGDTLLSIDPLDSKPIVEELRPMLILNLGIALFGGLVVGYLLACLREYLSG